MLQTRRCLDVNLEELQQELERARPALSVEAYKKLRTALDALTYLQELVADQDMTMAELRRLVVVRGGTEKTRVVLGRLGLEADPPHRPPTASSTPADVPRPPAPGHGRHGAEAYAGARRIAVAHGALRPGDRCPLCTKGKVYVQREPTQLIRFVGQAPLAATVELSSIGVETERAVGYPLGDQTKTGLRARKEGNRRHAPAHHSHASGVKRRLGAFGCLGAGAIARLHPNNSSRKR
jgi:hypothetical protein